MEEKAVETAVETAVEQAVKDQVRELVIRTGKAQKETEPVKTEIKGAIDSPFRWLEKRLPEIDQKTCYVIVDRESKVIILQVDESSEYGSLIQGSLKLSPELETFGINTGRYITHYEMAELLKMNRSLFENKQVAMNLVTDLQNFKAKVDKQIEDTDNRRGDKRFLLNQAVQSNLPEAFNLKIPIFRGQKPQTVSVEVYINASDFTCSLISAEANDIINETRDEIMDDVIDKIGKVAPDIVIIEK